MLVVTICYIDDDITGFMVNGHAKYAPHGEDICCAGVSAVTQTALIGLINHLAIKPDYSIKAGDLTVNLPSNLLPADKEKAQIILSTMVAGLKSMEEQYQKFIEIKLRRC